MVGIWLVVDKLVAVSGFVDGIVFVIIVIIMIIKIEGVNTWL